jgi:putative glutamine amidotransferase
MQFRKWSVKLSLSLACSLLVLSCNQIPDRKIIIISKDSKSVVGNWLRSINPELEIINAYGMSYDSLQIYLHKANGIVLSGGEDVHPQFYGKESYLHLCEKTDIYRDTMEFGLIDFAMKNDIPLLAICRGQQILNVRNGGTLIPDIPTYYPGSNHRSKAEYVHSVVPVKNSWLSSLTSQDTIPVNSRHHQSVDITGLGFEVAAYSTDSIIESIIYTDTTIQHFALGVQWHPEILNDSLSMRIGALFLSKI